MRTFKAAMMIMGILLLCSVGYAVTLTVDDIPAGEGVSYYRTLNCCFFGFTVAEHTQDSWWSAHSGTKVLVCSPDEHPSWLMLAFKRDGEMIGVSRVGGYFSTQSGVVLQMAGYVQGQDAPIVNATIGAEGEAWSNRYIEVTSTSQNINKVIFTPVSSDDALLHFCVDDVTVEPTPQP